MSNNSKSLPKWSKTKKGQERFELILDHAEDLLSSSSVESLGIQEVSRMAGLPTQAVYRLFPSPAALIHGLAERYLRQIETMNMELAQTLDIPWQDAIQQVLTSTVQFYDEHPIAMELILGSSVSREVRSADRENISRISRSLSPLFEHIEDDEILALMELRMEIAIDIVDAIWSHSYYLHSRITPFFVEESFRAIVSYIELYTARHRY